MWNSWVAPVVGYGIRGTFWIQGEQNCNATDAPTYGDRFNLLIKGWRAAWGQGDFPFYFGQLSNIHSAQTDPNSTSNVAEVREGQRLALALANTAMSVNFDIGTPNNWHFPNKPEAGRRLSLPARALVYGESSLVYSGPLYLSKTIAGNKVTLLFDHVGGGLVAKSGGALSGFAIAGATGNWVWGDAVISGSTVVVSSATVPTPTRVRYGWGDDPVISLFNKEGLPASSFTTESPDLAPSQGGAGGAGGSGGSTGTGGVIGTGGTNAAGGTAVAGGTTVVAGATAAGGTTPNGGTTRTGGTTAAAAGTTGTGGATSIRTGGSTTAGGITATGATTSAGGATASGGAAAAPSGGSMAAGGSIATGGATVAIGGATSTGGALSMGGTIEASGGIANTGGGLGGASPLGGTVNTSEIAKSASTSGSGGSGTGGTDGTGTGPKAEGCSCRVAGQSSPTASLASLGLLGLVTLRLLRRRRLR
jgi:MYXO-CTERM domain-containing protein